MICRHTIEQRNNKEPSEWYSDNLEPYYGFESDRICEIGINMPGKITEKWKVKHF